MDLIVIAFLSIPVAAALWIVFKLLGSGLSFIEWWVDLTFFLFFLGVILSVTVAPIYLLLLLIEAFGWIGGATHDYLLVGWILMVVGCLFFFFFEEIKEYFT